jgi:hypothetical protein
MKSTTEEQTMNGIKVTRERHGKKTWYFIYEDGVLRKGYPMKSTREYTHVHVQRWEGDEDPDAWAARFTASPKKIGSKIEYGYVADILPIEEAVA